MSEVNLVRVCEDNFVPIPREMLDAVGMKEGDTVHFFREPGGAWSIVPMAKLGEFKAAKAEDIMRRYHETLERL